MGRGRQYGCPLLDLTGTDDDDYGPEDAAWQTGPHYQPGPGARLASSSSGGTVTDPAARATDTENNQEIDRATDRGRQAGGFAAEAINAPWVRNVPHYGADQGWEEHGYWMHHQRLAEDRAWETVQRTRHLRE